MNGFARWSIGFTFLIGLIFLGHGDAKEAADPKRFESVIRAFESEDEKQKPPEAARLFVGASNIRLWSSLPERFKNEPVLNRGFGGAHLSDVVYFLDRIVLPYKPEAIYLNAGGNDLHAGRRPEDVAASFKEFVDGVRRKLPDVKISYISIPPSPARWSEVEQVKEANRLIVDLARQSQVEFLDVFSLLIGSDGLPRPECYVDDKLHFSEAGYDLVTSAIRWQKVVLEFDRADKAIPPPQDPILFIGSSSIVRWKTLEKDFPELPVMNRGFGGSELFDSVTYAHRLVFPYRPKMIVMYAGGNDIHRGKLPERVAADFRAFVARVHRELPRTRIAYISIAGNPARWSQVDRVKQANRLIEEFTKTDNRLVFINVFPHMMENGEPKPDIFVKDRLHMNEKGYEIWKEIVGPYLRQ